MNAQQNNSKCLRRRLFIIPVAVLIVIVAAAVYLHTKGAERLTFDRIGELVSYVDSLGARGPAIYIGVASIAAAVFVPATPILLVASVFGAVMGTVYASIALTAGAALSFLLSRYAFRPTMEHLIGHTAAFRKIDAGVKKDGWRMIMLTRLVGVPPYTIQNFGYGLTAVPFWIYVLTTWLAMLPVVAAWVFAAGALISGKGSIGKTMLYLAIGGVLLVALSFAPRLLKKRANESTVREG